MVARSYVSIGVKHIKQVDYGAEKEKGVAEGRSAHGLEEHAFGVYRKYVP